MGWLAFNRRTFFLFFGLGLLVFMAPLIFQGPWFKQLGFLPWLVLVTVGILDVAKRNLTRTISYSTGLLLSYAVLVSYLLGRPIVSDYASRRPFDSVVWKDADEADWRKPVRLFMIDDLLKRYSLQGMSRKQIEELLGVPRPTTYFKEYDYVYWLGPERGLMSIDSEWLAIKFKEDVIVDARVVRD